MATPWLETVRSLAHERAIVGERKRRGTIADLAPFNGRWEHIQTVVRLAMWLAAQVGADAEVVLAAAWLHDIRKEEAHHAELAADEAPNVLANTDFPAEKVPAVVDAIRKHEGLYKDFIVQPLEAAVLWDADKLTKLGAEGTLQFIASYSGQARSLAEWLAEQEQFMTLAGKIAASMNTPPAQHLARQRLNTMRRWLDDLHADLVI